MECGTPTITLEALTIAYASTPFLRPSDFTAPSVMIETISTRGATYRVTSAFTAPLVIDLTFPLMTLRALTFMLDLRVAPVRRTPAL